MNIEWKFAYNYSDKEFEIQCEGNHLGAYKNPI